MNNIVLAPGAPVRVPVPVPAPPQSRRRKLRQRVRQLILENKGKKKHRHSHDYQRLVSGSETEPDIEGEDDRGGTRNPKIIKLLEKHSIQKLPKLNKEEEKLFELVSSGNVSGVKDFFSKIEDNSTCDYIQALNFEGYTVLHIAAARQDEEMVDALCSEYGHCVEPKILQDVLLHAIVEENINIVNQLVDIMKGRRIGVDRPNNPSRIFQQEKPFVMNIFPNSNFTDDITPYILAAQGKSLEIMNIFYTLSQMPSQSEHRCLGLEEPHEVDCMCYDCKRYSEIGRAIRCLNLFKANCNPTYICFKIMKVSVKEDPIFLAFNLIKQLEINLKKTEHFASDYDNLIQDLKKFTCSLLNQCRDIDEVNCVLRQKEGYSGDDDFRRLAWAIELEIKEFVANPHSQMVLYGIWTEGWPNYHRHDIMFLFAYFLFLMPTFWIMAIVCLFNQTAGYPAIWASPAGRFFSSLASYVDFLLCLFLINWVESGPGDRGPPFTGLEIPVIIWTVGHIISIVIQICTDGRNYLSSAWTWFDILTQLTFIGSFVCWALALAIQKNKSAFARELWSPYEPILVGEGLFAMASIMAYARPIRLLRLHNKMGPMISGMGEMWKDILDVLTFIGVIIGSFSLGYYYIYRNYYGWKDYDSSGSEIYQSEQFTTYSEVLNSLFFSLMVEIGVDSTLILPRNVTDPKNHNLTAINHHIFNENTGKLIFVAFHIVGSMMAMNLVGGLVISHYDRIREDVDTEWKFMRGKMFMSFARGTVNPSPLNCIPTIPFIIGKKKISSRPSTPCKYESLSTKLVERYIRGKAEFAEAEKANAEILTALREDLAELREAIHKSEAIWDKINLGSNTANRIQMKLGSKGKTMQRRTRSERNRKPNSLLKIGSTLAVDLSNEIPRETQNQLGKGRGTNYSSGPRKSHQKLVASDSIEFSTPIGSQSRLSDTSAAKIQPQSPKSSPIFVKPQAQKPSKLAQPPLLPPAAPNSSKSALSSSTSIARAQSESRGNIQTQLQNQPPPGSPLQSRSMSRTGTRRLSDSTRNVQFKAPSDAQSGPKK